MRPECEKFRGRSCSICNGMADLPAEKINKYRERWGLEPLPDEEISGRPSPVPSQVQMAVSSARVIQSHKEMLAPVRSPYPNGSKSQGKAKSSGCCGGGRKKAPPVESKTNGYGPGSQLLNLWSDMPHCDACQALAAKMDAWGKQGCTERIDLIVTDIFPRAQTWVKANKPWVYKALSLTRTEGPAIRLAIYHNIKRAIELAEDPRELSPKTEGSAPRLRDPSRLNVGLLTPTLLFGGAERWVASLASGLDGESIQITGVALREAGKVFPAIAQKLQSPIIQGTEAFQQLSLESDVLIAWGLSDLSQLSGFHGRVVMVSHGHCDWTSSAIKKCLPYVTDWVAVSEHAASAFPDPSRVAVLHNGIDIDRCEAGRPRDTVRDEWGIGPNEVAIGYVGRMSGEKRPLCAVEAVKHLGPPYRAVLAGGGPNTAYWISKAQQILPSVVYQHAVEDVGELYRALDAFVLASPAEGFSLALAEAWYCKCPTISTHVGATEVMDVHGQMGVIVPVGATPAVLASAVKKAISPNNREVVDHASRIVAAHYTSEMMCQRWSDYLLNQS